MIYWVIVWFIMGALVAMVANSKGRNAALWFVYGFLVWPIALIHASRLKGDEPPTIDNHPPGPLPPINLWERAQTPVGDTKAATFAPAPSNRWFIHRGRRVEIASDGVALVDGHKFEDADAAKVFLNEKYPDQD